MGRTIYYTATTLDGFLATEDDSLQWLFDVPGSDSANDRFGPFMAGVGGILMGASTYLWILGHEQVVEHPERWEEWYGGKDCVVMTTRVPAGRAGRPLRERRRATRARLARGLRQGRVGGRWW